MDYVVTFKHDGSEATVSTHAEARILAAQSPKGGSIRTVPRKK